MEQETPVEGGLLRNREVLEATAGQGVPGPTGIRGTLRAIGDYEALVATDEEILAGGEALEVPVVGEALGG